MYYSGKYFHLHSDGKKIHGKGQTHFYHSHTSVFWIAKPCKGHWLQYFELKRAKWCFVNFLSAISENNLWVTNICVCHASVSAAISHCCKKSDTPCQMLFGWCTEQHFNGINTRSHSTMLCTTFYSDFICLQSIII